MPYNLAIRFPVAIDCTPLGQQGAWPSANGQALLHFFGLFSHFKGVLATKPGEGYRELHAGYLEKTDTTDFAITSASALE